MNIEIIGSGVMGSAFAKSLRRNSSAFRIFVADRDPVKARILAKRAGAKVDNGYRQLDKADMVILAVKPQDFSLLAQTIKGRLRQHAILFSIAAGVTIGRIKNLFGHAKVVRVMPNLGLSVGQGIAAWKASVALTKNDLARARKVLDSVTDNFPVKDENMIDAVTAISGSGPAYFFFLANVLLEAGLTFGFKRAEARTLVEKTLLASAFLQNGADYEALIGKVASRKGTTEAALKVLKKHGADRIIKRAVRAAWRRARKLSL